MNFPMKLIPTCCLSFAVLVSAAGLAADLVQPTAAARVRLSPHETISTTIAKGGPRLTLTYGRPYSKDPKTGEIRKIWGGLVKWDKADRLGADEATVLITQHALQFGDITIPAGAYTLYLVPSETGTAQLAFSSSLGKWGVPVDEAHDVARVPLVRAQISAAVDQLTLGVPVNAAGDGGSLTIQWETTQFSAPFTLMK
jgi:hypothetical protein